MSLDGPPYMPPTPCTVCAVADDRVHFAQKVTSSPERTHGVFPTSHVVPTSMCIFVSMHRRYSSVWLGRPHTSTERESASRQSA